MDGDAEPAMAYFLPNGITDDSPPKKSRVKASFGPIGGRSAAVTSSQLIAVSSMSAAVVSAAPGASNSRSDVDFSGPHTRPRPTLEPSPFGPSGASSSSSRPTNYLLSDLGGEIHTPLASRAFGDSGGSEPSSGSAFGFPGAFGPALSDGGAIGGAGAIRSPSSMFDRGQEAAKSFSMQGEGSRSMTSSESFGSESQQLYGRGASNLSSYLSAGDADSPFGSGSMRTWPSSATDTSQPRRALQRPPGLAGPPGLSEPSAMDIMQPRMRFGSGGGGDMMPHVSRPQFGPFHPSTSSPMASSSRVFSSAEDQYGPSLLSSLSLSADVFGKNSLRDQTENRGVSNPDLAELNTHSVKVGDVGDIHVRRAVDSSSAMWDNREPTTSRRIDIQARSKTPRSPKKARDGRRKSETRSDLRAKALEFSMDAINAFTPGSPTRTRRSERGRKSPSPVSLQEASPASYENNRNGSDQSAQRGKRRNHVADKGAVSSSSNTSGNDSRKRGPTNQSEERESSLTPPPSIEPSVSPVELAPREANKSRRREDTKFSSRSTSRRNSTRGVDKGAGTTRRQVYREKQVKENVKELASPEETPPVIVPPSTVAAFPQTSQANGDGQHSEVKLHERKQNATQDAKSNASSKTKADALPEASKSASVSTTTATDANNKIGAKSSGKLDRDVAGDRSDGAKNSGADDATSSSLAASTHLDVPSENPAARAEGESSSSSDDLENAHDGEPDEPRQVNGVESPESDDILSPGENFESDAERTQPSADQHPVISTKKSKRKAIAPVVSPTDSSPPAFPAEAKLPVLPESSQAVEKKHAAKEHRKEKAKKDKGDKKKSTRGKKDKRSLSSIAKAADTVNESATEAQDKLLEALATNSTPISTRISQGLHKGGLAASSAGLLAFRGSRRGCTWVAARLNVKGLLATTFSYVESVLAVVFSVVLLLSLHAASWFIRIHRVAFRAILTHRHIGFCFAFLYGFPFLVQYVFPWAPPWAPVCLWYAFLVQLFCTNGPTAMVTTFRVILPLVFLVEGISHHSFLLDLNGAELLLTSFIISALKTSNLCSPIFFLSLATQCLLAVFLGSELIVQWLQLALALYSLHVMAATDDEWIGIGEEEDELSCHPVSNHHSIADYNHHPAPSSVVSIQKTKRLDRRALAYVRGRKLR